MAIRKNTQVTKKKAIPKAPVQKKKIAKPKQAKKEVPRKEKVEKELRVPRLKTFYTLREDAEILNTLQNEKTFETKTALVKHLAKTLERSEESIRDRIRRYLKNLNLKDKNMIIKKAKSEPASYIAFNKDKTGKNLIHGVSKVSNNLRQSKKIVSVNSFDWVIRNLKSDDPYFSTDHGAQLMNCLLIELENQNVSKQAIEKFIKNQENPINLQEIFDYFELK